MAYYIYMKFNGQLLQGELATSKELAIMKAGKYFENWKTSGMVRHYAVYYGKDKVFDTEEREDTKF